MTIYNKPDAQVFAKEAKQGEITTFPDIARGWGVTLDTTNGIPPMEFFNALQNRTDEALGYLMQRGVAEWREDLEYPKHAITILNGQVFFAKQQNANKNPLSNPEIWVNSFAQKANVEDVYNKTQTDLLLNKKANVDDVFNQAASIENLRTIEPKQDKERITLLSYYENGVTGGGEFVYNESSKDEDDGGAVIVTGGGARWHRVVNDFLSSDDFGIVSTSERIDQSDKFQALFISASTLNVKAIVKKGEYTINNAVTISCNAIFECDSKFRSLSSTYDENTQLVFNNTINLERLWFIGIKVRLHFGNQNNITPANISNCSFFNSTLRVGTSKMITGGYSVKFNSFICKTKLNEYAISLANTSDVDITHNRFLRYSDGVKIESTISYAVNNVNIENNEMQWVDRPIRTYGSSANTFSSISIISNNIINPVNEYDNVSIFLLNCYSTVIKNNTLNVQKGDAIRLIYSYDTVISNNKITVKQENSSNCIRLNSCINTIIKYNFMKQYQPNVGSVYCYNDKRTSIKNENLYITNNIIEANNKAIKIEDTQNVHITNNKIRVAHLNDHYLTHCTNCSYGIHKDNIFEVGTNEYDIRPTDNDLSYSEPIQQLPEDIIKISKPTITASDFMLNNSKSYVVEFTVNNAMLIHQNYSQTAITMHEHMRRVGGARLAFNCGARPSEALPQVIDGEVLFPKILEDTPTKSCVLIDTFNNLYCRNYATISQRDDRPSTFAMMSVREHAWQAVAFWGPIVVDGLKSNWTESGLTHPDWYNIQVSARTCLGQKADGTYVLLVVDGKTNVNGCTVEQAAEKMKSLGCINAFNLDGGGSTTLWYNGEIINSPSDAGGARAVTQVMYIK